MQLYPISHYDDTVNGFTDIQTIPLAAAIGAEIRGADLANLSGEQFNQIKAALFHYKMIYFRNQNIQISDQEAFTLRFGDYGTDAYTSGMEGHPNVQRLVKEADTVVPRVFGDGWHTDSPFMTQPPSVSILRSIDIPPYGGDTWWSNSELAYEQLSPSMKQDLSSLKVHMSAENVIRFGVEKSNDSDFNVGEMNLTMDQKKIIKGAFHPLVRTHPETGKKSLYVDEAYSMGIEGMSKEESAPLLKELADHITQDDFTCRLRWEENTVVLWDNRICIHKAFNDYDGYRREMHRTIVNGEAPA